MNKKTMNSHTDKSMSKSKIRSKRKYTEDDVRMIVQNSVNNIFNMYLNAEAQRQRLLKENNNNNTQIKNTLEEHNQTNSNLMACNRNVAKTKMLIDNFDSKCSNYFQFKKRFDLVLKQLKVSSALIALRLKNSTDNDEKEYLKQKIIASENELIIRKKLNKMINDFDCKRLKNFMLPYEMVGGEQSNQSNQPNQTESTSEIEYKISKYADKFSADTFNPLYKKKLESYIDDLQGGAYNNNINITIPAIDNILNNKFSLITSIPAFQGLKKSIKPELCLNSLDDYDDEQSYNMDVFDLPYNCIKNPLTNNPNYSFNKLTYNFKRDTKAISTDTFMQNTLNENLYSLLCDYCTFELTATVSEFVHKFNSKLAPAKKLAPHDLVLMYKGGNTTRLYIKTLLNTLKRINPVGNFSSLKNILSKLTVGDWDYNISIDFPSLRTKGFTDAEINQLMDQCRQVVLLGLYKIKAVLTELFETSLSEEYIQTLKLKYYGVEYIAKIQNYINEFNTQLNKPYNIESLNINQIKTANYVVDNGSIKFDQNNQSLNVASIAVSDDKLVKNNSTDPQNNIQIKNVDSIVAFFSDQNLNEYIPDFLTPNNFSITYINPLNFHRFRSYMSFSLYRLKFNNSLIMNLKKDTNPKDMPLKLKIPVELVDISMSLPTDNLYLFKEVYMRLVAPAGGAVGGAPPKFNKFIDFEYTSNTNKAKLSIPSPEYMFYDICAMLFVNQMVVWEDCKYFKRIERISYLAIICELMAGRTIDQLTADYNTLLAFYQNLSVQNTSLDVVYNIITDAAYPNKLREVKLNTGTPSEARVLQLTNPLINFYLDKFIANYLEMIVMLKYITLNPAQYPAFTFNDYCTKQFKVSRDIDAGQTITEITELIGLARLQDPAKIAENYTELKKYEAKMIELIGGIIAVLNQIRAGGINNVVFDFNTINQLF